MPSGIASAIVSILTPFLLRKHGVSVDRIAEVVAIASIPYVWYFAYSPLVDLGLRRKTWIAASALIAASFCAGAMLIAGGSVPLLTVLLFLASAVSGLQSSANGALLTSLHPAVRGRASGWYQGGNLGGGAVGGGVAIWLAGIATLPMLAAGVFLLIVLPAAAALWIRETPRLARATHPLPSAFAPLWHDLRTTFTTGRTWIGLLFFLSPVGCGALANLISSVGPDYHAPDSEVLWVTGIASGLLSAGGAMLGGFLCDRMNRMVAYALGGGLTAVCGAYLLFARHGAFTFGAGYSGYSIANGFAYAVFTALVLEVLGSGRKAAGTCYSILVASSNLPINLMTWIDGRGYKHWGVNGLMGVDAITEGGGALALLLVAWIVRGYWHKTAQQLAA